MYPCDCGAAASVIDTRVRRDGLTWRTHVCDAGHRFHSVQLRRKEYERLAKRLERLRELEHALKPAKQVLAQAA